MLPSQYCRLLPHLLTIANQIKISQPFKRFASAATSEIIKIREEQTKSCTKWATKVFQGK